MGHHSLCHTIHFLVYFLALMVTNLITLVDCVSVAMQHQVMVTTLSLHHKMHVGIFESNIFFESKKCMWE